MDRKKGFWVHCVCQWQKQSFQGVAMSGGNIPLISAKSNFCLQRNSIWKYFFLLLDGIPYGQSLQIYIEKPKLKSTSALRKKEEKLKKKKLSRICSYKKAFYILNPQKEVWNQAQLLHPSTQVGLSCPLEPVKELLKSKQCS